MARKRRAARRSRHALARRTHPADKGHTVSAQERIARATARRAQDGDAAGQLVDAFGSALCELPTESELLARIFPTPAPAVPADEADARPAPPPNSHSRP